MKCPNCGQDLAPGAESCPACSSSLAGADTPPVPGAPDLVTILETNDPSLLPVLQSLLQAEGIPCVVTNEVAQDFIGYGRLVTGFNPVIGPAHLQVAPENVEAARALIAFHVAPTDTASDETSADAAPDEAPAD